MVVIKKHKPQRKRRSSSYGFMARLGIVGAYSAFMILLGAVLQKQSFYGSVLRPIVEANVRLPVHYVKSRQVRPDRLDLDISMRNLRQLEFDRYQALATGALLPEHKNFVRGSIRHDGSEIPVRVRLKGDTLRPLLDNKWSFRAKTRRDTALFGMKQFSLHHPRERNYLFEWLFHRTLKREGLIGLEYRFAELVINGRSQGIYALEEHFEKRLVESNERREGPIVRFNEELMWHDIRRTREAGPREFGRAGAYLAAEVDGFQTDEQLNDEPASALYFAAVHALESFRQEDSVASEVFDTERLATYFALLDLFGGGHAAHWHNLRFYYNPITTKLEPVGFDANAGQPAMDILGLARAQVGARMLSDRRLLSRLFEDESFFRAYVSELERIAAPAYLDGLLAEMSDEIEAHQAALWRSYPEYVFSPDVLYRNQAYIREILDPQAALRAYSAGRGGDTVQIEACNLQMLPVEVLGLVGQDGRLVGLSDACVLPARDPLRPVDPRLISVQMPNDGADLEVASPSVLYRILGTSSKPKSAPLTPHPFLPLRAARMDLSPKSSTIGNLEWLSVDQEHRVVSLRPGQWTLAEDLIIPPGYTFRCTEGTTLDLTNRSVIVSHSPLEFVGSEDRPIRLESSDGTGQGLVVLGAPSVSTLKHVIFERLGSPSRDGWTLTGAVTFYESRIVIHDCIFAENTSEDALNLIRSQFEMSNSVFTGTFSDAFDADFCSGTVQDCRFVKCGNDGIDVSGSSVSIARVDFREIGDKGLSCGEHSQAQAEDLDFNGARLAIASKDRSSVHVSRTTISGCEYGLAVFQKKSEFGGADLTVDQAIIRDTPMVYLLESSSDLRLNGSLQQPNTDDARSLLYGSDG